MNLEMNGVFGFGSNLLGWNSGPAEQMEPGMEMAMKRRATSPLVNGTVGESCEKRPKVDALKPPSTPGNVMQALDLVLRKAGDVQEELRMAKQDPSMGRRVFQCSACNTYYENWNLFLHMREVHKKHICLICLGLFGTAERLAKHLRGRHKMDDSHLDSKRELMTLNQNRSCYLMCVQCEHVFQEMVAGSEDEDNARTSSYQLLKNHRCESFMDQRRPEKVKKVVEEKREMVEVKKEAEEAVISDKTIGSFKNYNVSTTGGSNELKLSFRLTKSEGHQSFNGHKEDRIEHSSIEGDEKRVESEIAPVKEESVPQLVPKLKVKIPKIMPPPDSDEYGSEEEDEDYEGEGEEEEDEEEDESEVEIENNEAESQIKTEPELEEKKGEDDEQEPVKSEEICEESGAMEPMAPVQPPEESDGIPVADEDCQMFELTLDEPLDKISIKDLLKICLRSTITFCLYCYHARRIAVNGKSLALHMVASHRFSATVNSITAEELLPETIVQRFKSGLGSVKDLFLNLESFDSETNAVREEQEQQEGVVNKHEKTFECFQCRFISGVHKELYLHNRKLHLKSVLLCLMCRSTFFNYSELLCHICPGQPSRVLNYDLQFRCCFCSLSSLPSAFRLMVHLRKHHATCEICLEECFDQFRLASHAWKHKLQHFCYRCGIAYRNKPDITKHLFWKHGTESVLCKKCLQKKWPHIFHFCTPPSSFTCEQCNLTFTRAVCLRVHKRLHSEELPHLCPEENCGEKFISKKLMQKHARVHSDAAEVENFYPYLLKSENEEIIETQPPQDEQDKDKEEAKLNPDQTEKTKQEMDESGVVEQKSATFPDQPSSLMAEIMNLPVPNLSESDSSDDDEDSGSVLVPKKEKEEPVLVENVLESEDIEETKECEEAIINIWENFKSYQATQAQQNPAQEEAAEEEEDLIAPAPPPILHVLQSDHDYGRMFKVLGEGKKEGDDEDIKEIKDISVMRNESRLAEKRIRALNGESSSSSESDSDSSCSCGSECSCSSSDGTSSCPTSSSDEEEMSSNLDKSANRKKQRKPRKRKGNSSDNIDVVDTDNKTISSAFVMMRESDLETDESETDEEFYDQHPEKVARELLAERRRQEVGGEGSGSRASTPSLPPGEEKYLTKEKKAKKSKKKKSKKSKREKQNFVPPLKINIPPLPMIPKLKILSSTTIPVISTSHHHHHLKASESLASFAEQQLTNSCDKSLKRSKRRRIPNRFYGYTSDDDSNSMPPATAAGLFRPTAPPQLTWKKEDLPSPAVSKSIAFNSSFSCNSNSNDFQLSSSSTNYSSSPLNTTTTTSRRKQQQHEWQAKEEEEEDGGLGRGAQLAPALQPAVRGDQQQQQAPPAWGGGGGAVIQAEQLYCFCRRAYDQASEMIACDGENCPIEWFHFECVNIIVAPQGLWFCPSCRPSTSSN